MNKKITLLLLIVVLAAMSLVLYSQMRQPDADSLIAGSAAGIDREGRVIPKSKQPGNGLPSIEPPLGGSVGADGAPKPVVMTAGKEAPAPQSPSGATDDGAKAPGADDKKKDEGPAQGKTSGAPELTPWETPPAKEPAQKAATPAPAKKPEKAAEKPQPKPAEKGKAEAKKPEAAPKKDDKTAQAKPQTTQPVEPGVRQLTRIKLTPKGQSMHLRIEADGGFSCKTFVLSGPDRLVIDLPGKWKGVQAPSVPSNQLVKKARVGEQPTGPRVVLDLTRPIKGHQVQRLNNAIEVVLQ